MTNGEKMQAVFPDIEMWGESKDTLDYSLGGMIHRVTKRWWNAEYKEPTTKNDLGVDKTFYEQIMEYCKEHFLVLVEKDVWDDAEKALTTKNDLGVEHHKQNIQAYAHDFGVSEEQAEKELAVKTNLEVDCISSKIAKEMHLEVANMKKIVQALSSVASQLSSELDKNSKKLEKDLGESDCISRADVSQVIEDYMDEQYHVLSDRTRERAFGANAVRARINELDPVTPIRPKGHWIIMKDIYGDIVDAICSNCEHHGHHKWNYCPNCSAEMKNNTIRKGKPIEGNNESYNCENYIP